MKSVSTPSARARSLKLVISAPQSVDCLAFLHDLAHHADRAVLRNYQLGTLDALRLETWRFSQELSLEMNISVHALIGHQQYRALQEVLLSNADGILILLDMHPLQRQASLQTIADTIQTLQRQCVDLREFPVVFLYHRAELLPPTMLQEWDHLLELERNHMPRYHCGSEFGHSSAQALETLITLCCNALNQQSF